MSAENSKNVVTVERFYSLLDNLWSQIKNKFSTKEDLANKKQSVNPFSAIDFPSSQAVALFVNSSIATNTANYISDNGQPFTDPDLLPTDPEIVTNNDYAFVTGTDGDGNTYYDRYKAIVVNNIVSWALEYRLNNSSFTAAQWASITSGITESLVNDYNAHLANSNIHVTIQDKSNWTAKYDKPNSGIPLTDMDQATQQGMQDAMNATLFSGAPLECRNGITYKLMNGILVLEYKPDLLVYKTDKPLMLSTTGVINFSSDTGGNSDVMEIIQDSDLTKSSDRISGLTTTSLYKCSCKLSTSNSNSSSGTIRISVPSWNSDPMELNIPVDSNCSNNVTQIDWYVKLVSYVQLTAISIPPGMSIGIQEFSIYEVADVS